MDTRFRGCDEPHVGMLLWRPYSWARRIVGMKDRCTGFFPVWTRLMGIPPNHGFIPETNRDAIPDRAGRLDGGRRMLSSRNAW